MEVSAQGDADFAPTAGFVQSSLCSMWSKLHQSISRLARASFVRAAINALWHLPGSVPGPAAPDEPAQPKPPASDPSGVGEIARSSRIGAQRAWASAFLPRLVTNRIRKRRTRRLRSALPEGSAARGLRLHREMPDAERPRRARGGNPCKCHGSIFGARGETCSGRFRSRGAPYFGVFVIRGETCSSQKNVARRAPSTSRWCKEDGQRGRTARWDFAGNRVFGEVRRWLQCPVCILG